MRINNTNIFHCLSVTVSCMLIASCNNTVATDKSNTTVSHARWYEKDSSNQITTTPQPQWAEMLRHDKGWIGADGIYSVATNGVEAPGKSGKTNTFFWFSDCIIGNIVADTLQSDWELLHNSVAYFNGDIPNPDSIHFFYRKDSTGHSLSMFEPHTPMSQPGNYYWLGDGFFNHALDSTTYIFAYLIKSVPGGIYPFDDIGLSLIAIPKNSKPPYTDQRQFDTPFFLKDSNGKGKVVFGVAVLPNTTGAGAPHPDG
ncbi:MAG: hypothetical protein ABI921_01295, partial [Panacibacter sp.]